MNIPTLGVHLGLDESARKAFLVRRVLSSKWVKYGDMRRIAHRRFAAGTQYGPPRSGLDTGLFGYLAPYLARACYSDVGRARKHSLIVFTGAPA